MMELSGILALFITFLLAVQVLLSWRRSHRQYRSLPPGPSPLPFVGTPKYMNMQAAAENYTKLSQQYGSIFTIWKLSEPAVVLCGYETVKDALVNHGEEFSARPIMPVLYISTKGYSFTGPRWRALRRFTISSLRNFGMGKKTMASRVLEEAEYLIQAVAENEGKPFNPITPSAFAVGNIISSVLFGEHFDYKDPKLSELITYTSRHIRNTVSPLNMLCNMLPFLLKLPILRHVVFRDSDYLKNFVMKYIEEHKRTLRPGAPRDFIDYYLLKIKEMEHDEDPDFCDTSLVMVLVGLLAAGSETTASTLKYCLVLLANYPDVQVKIQQEIDDVVGSMRHPGIEDRPQMSYTNAVIHEIQRVLDLAPTALFHSVTKEIQFRGYTIPKGTMIIPFLTSVLYDPSQWETPDEFNPGHFLDEDGQFRNRVAFMPFSAGKRVCLGENLARMELFLLLSALLQKFTFKVPPGTERQDSKSLYKNKTSIIASGQICAVPRSSPAK
ncbi:cytochrome P450 2C29-like [Gastrophryne carolinensis]